MKHTCIYLGEEPQVNRWTGKRTVVFFNECRDLFCDNQKCACSFGIVGFRHDPCLLFFNKKERACLNPERTCISLINSKISHDTCQYCFGNCIYMTKVHRLSCSFIDHQLFSHIKSSNQTSMVAQQTISTITFTRLVCKHRLFFHCLWNSFDPNKKEIMSYQTSYAIGTASSRQLARHHACPGGVLSFHGAPDGWDQLCGHPLFCWGPLLSNAGETQHGIHLGKLQNCLPAGTFVPDLCVLSCGGVPAVM